MTAKQPRESADTRRPEMVITRTFAAPRELVWRAWTDPQQIVKWWGPNGFTNTLFEMDVRPGGVWRHMMHGPDGTDYPNEVAYIEVVEPERLVYSLSGNRKGSPCQFHVTVTFEAVADTTILTLRMLFESEEEWKSALEYGALEGGNQTFARLAQHLQTLPATTPP